MMRVVIGLVIANLAVAAIGLTYGDYAVSPGDIARILTGQGPVGLEASMVIAHVRLPRLLLGFLVGVALAVAGALAQAVMRNPLAEPGLLGINSGAALAAMILIVHLGGSAALLPAVSFGGAAVMTAGIYLIAWRSGTSSMRIILVGIGMSALAGAVTSFLTAFGDVRDVQRAMIWFSGSVYDSNWAKVEALATWSALPLVLSWLLARDADVIGFGDLAARSMGQRAQAMRGFLILLCTLLSCAAVASAGLIAFVGLIAPHVARRLVGPLHGRLLPVAALFGGLLVLIADLLGRTIIAPAQLPAGLMTALVGPPFFAYMMWKRNNAPG